MAGPVVLALFARDALEDDSEAWGLWTGNGGIVVAQNLASESDVDAMMARAEAVGARILKPAGKTFWGGYGTDMCGRSPPIRFGNSIRMAG